MYILTYLFTYTNQWQYQTSFEAGSLTFLDTPNPAIEIDEEYIFMIWREMPHTIFVIFQKNLSDLTRNTYLYDLTKGQIIL